MCLQVKNQNECEKIQDNVENNKDVIVKKYMNRRILMKHAMMDSEEAGEVCKPDILAISTQYTRQAFMKIQTLVNQGQKSTCYKILTRTTQPAHAIAVSVVFFIGFLLWPEQYADQDDVDIISRRANGLTTVLYLGSFATHFGAQIWMTFVSGLALYFSLPRHTFGMCQEVLFPKYFTLNTILSTLTLYSFVRMNKYNTNSAMVQIVALCVCLLLELVVRLYFTPPLLKLMRQKYKMEQKIGTGSEIGQEVQGELISCPHYQKIHKQFRRIHMMTAIANICTMVCTFIHLNYLASKITFL